MSDNEAKALELVAEAEKKLNSSKSFLGGLFGWAMIFLLGLFQGTPFVVALLL